MKICRDIIERLKKWKDSENRKPILLKGARQTGKTWIMSEFGKECFEYVAEFNFDKTEELNSIFEKTKDINRILKELMLFTEVPIEAGKTLIIFDEIQMCEGALNSLKYFCEDAPQYHVIAAGSLLGVAIRRKKMSVPVGKVQILKMFPVTFKEFLLASDERTSQYVDTLNSLEALPEIILNKLELEYKRYLICGGMPEAVTALLENKGMQAVEDTLQNILDLYTLDFSKYASPVDIPRIDSLWSSLPSQLAKENRKFIYRIVKTGARAREYEDALLWLEEAGLIYRIFNVSKPGLPLSAYQDLSAFKVYACDCGLLRRLAKLSPEVILSGNYSYTEFKGALTENAILQSLVSGNNDVMPYYWSSENRAEVDFVLQFPTMVVPVEVKSDTRISGKSLSVYTNKFNPPLRIRFSMNNLKENDGLLSCPIPLTDWLYKIINLMTTGRNK
ncbi:ATP-binding protein [Bacteroides sp. RTP21281st1_E4_RTP21281_210402]|uniref:ATP-binding protein n=1 Tax=unclassified Bacteroides TaxID=2646097 RepID=UPI0034A1D375